MKKNKMISLSSDVWEMLSKEDNASGLIEKLLYEYFTRELSVKSLDKLSLEQIEYLEALDKKRRELKAKLDNFKEIDKEKESLNEEMQIITKQIEVTLNGYNK
jgi:uncharacterized protein involved in exopolysaccharide biosynthesis